MTKWEYCNRFDFQDLNRAGFIPFTEYRNHELYSKYNAFLICGVERKEARRRVQPENISRSQFFRIIKDQERQIK